jgi:hypothetical protein
VLEVAPVVSISSDDNTDSYKVSNCQCDSEHDSGVDMHIKDDVDAPDGAD